MYKLNNTSHLISKPKSKPNDKKNSKNNVNEVGYVINKMLTPKQQDVIEEIVSHAIG